MSQPDPPPPKPTLDRITTQWSIVKDPVQFVVRYAAPIRNYLGAMLRDPHDAEEVTQEFLLRVFQHGFARADPDRGRFRDYLRTAVRNAARTYMRRKQTGVHAAIPLAELPENEGPLTAERNWVADWQKCLLERAWRALDSHQHRTPGNLFHTVLRLTADYPDEDSVALAERVSVVARRPIRADAFRKQLSRARRQLAELLWHEVAQTLDNPTPAEVEAELLEVGLMPYVRDYLPDDWRGQPTGESPE